MISKSNRNYNTWKKIKKRLKYLKSIGACDDNAIEFIEQPHRLAKDKLENRYHNMHTNNKTKRQIYGNYQKSRNYSKSDMQKIDRLNYEN